MAVALSGVVTLAKRLEVDHKVGVAVLWHGSSFALAVAETQTGDVLAWDGWYLEDSRPEGVKNVLDLDWKTWGDMPSKLVFEANAYWLADYLGHWLMPTYSVAQEAGNLLNTHAQSVTSAENARSLSSAEIVAYLPVVDYDVFVQSVGSDPLA